MTYWKSVALRLYLLLWTGAGGTLGWFIHGATNKTDTVGATVCLVLVVVGFLFSLFVPMRELS
jgi:hypothetical protein